MGVYPMLIANGEASEFVEPGEAALDDLLVTAKPPAELSTPARPQPIRSASRKRRRQVTPEPHPISAGSISPEMPVRRMNTMPVSAARAVTSGRPPSGLAEIGGSRGSTINHKASGETELGIPSHASPRIRA
jgi:hypothetical protein